MAVCLANRHYFWIYLYKVQVLGYYLQMDREKISRKITVADMAPHVHSFMPSENKSEKIANWLINWIELSLECGKIKPFDLLPSKGDLACHIGVSQGTVQSAFRIVEDAGWVESKQRIGTYIKNKHSSNFAEKLTSKRELAIEIVKKYILEVGYKEGDIILSIRKLAELTGISTATIRMAFANLIMSGILAKEKNNYVVRNIDFNVEIIKSQTLVEKLANSLKAYIKTELEVGATLPTNKILAKKFNTSIKTVHDAVKILAKEGLLLVRRGQYGITVLDDKTEQNNVELYDYEKIEQKIRTYMVQNCNLGDKLPSIKEFSKVFLTSEKTIKKALDNLAEDGYIAFSRGRYGGTFVLDIPQSSIEAYKWLAISSDYVSGN